jgi:hypothetical protein
MVREKRDLVYLSVYNFKLFSVVADLQTLNSSTVYRVVVKGGEMVDIYDKFKHEMMEMASYVVLPRGWR